MRKCQIHGQILNKQNKNMKAILYIILAIFIGSIIMNAIPVSPSYNQTITIQSIEQKRDSDKLKASCEIIKNRLNDLGIRDFKIKSDLKTNIIKISFLKSIDTEKILPLLVSKGEIGFYETYTRSEGLQIPGINDSLISLLNIPEEKSFFEHNSAILGYFKADYTSIVEKFISKNYVSKAGSGIKFAWSKDTNQNGESSLYMLKQNAALDNQQITEVSVNKVNNSYDLMITFNEKGTEIWQNLTKNNINKSIAIVIDNRVYAAPVVRDEIKGGKCIITGNFSLEDVTMLKSLLGNEKLPLEFEVVK